MACQLVDIESPFLLLTDTRREQNPPSLRSRVEEGAETKMFFTNLTGKCST